MSWQTIIKENNLEVSVVFLSNLLASSRLDSEFYQNYFLNLQSVLAKKRLKKISDFSDVTDGEHGSPDLDDASGIFYLSGQNIKDGEIDYFNSVRFCTSELHKKNRRSELKRGNVLLSIVGTVGNSAIVTENIIGNTDRNVATIKNIKDFNPFYVSVFLGSSFGKLQTVRYCTGNVQPLLNLTQVKNILIPEAENNFQLAIQKTIERFLELNKSSRQKYSDAEQLLLKEINLEGYKGTDEAISVRNFSEALADNRFDAEYWQPKYDEITKRVSKVPQEKLGDIVSAKKGVEVGSEAYAEEGKDFIRVSDFTIYGIEGVEKKISEELYDGLKENYKPKKGEVLFTKDGTIGISFALNEDVDAIVSGAFLRLKPKVKINNNYLALVLNSFYCKAQIERMSGGAVIAHLKPESAMQIKVPMLSEKKQEELASKVLEALRLRKEAKELLEKAKRAVEIFVEKDEKEALNFLQKSKT